MAESVTRARLVLYFVNAFHGCGDTQWIKSINRLHDELHNRLPLMYTEHRLSEQEIADLM